LHFGKAEDKGQTPIRAVKITAPQLGADRSSDAFDRIVEQVARTLTNQSISRFETERSNMAVENDAAWDEWEDALKRVKSAGDALKELSGGSQITQKREDAEEELEAALEALEDAADKITSDDDDEDDDDIDV
jgi:hypothetical protein